MLNIQTFDQRAGGNVLYKALSHPLAAERVRAMFTRLRAAGPIAVYDPEGIAEALFALYADHPPLQEIYVHDVTLIGHPRAGLTAKALSDLPTSQARAILVAAFDAGRTAARIAHLLPQGAEIISLDDARLPDTLLTNQARYLDKQNFATNHVFFREADGLSTRLVSANYWANHGASAVRFWLRLYGETGAVLAEWEQPAPPGPGGIVIDSAAVRARFALPQFTGQLFLHAIGAAGHDVVKYALDTYANDSGPNGDMSLSCTHDANAWPSDRYAGLPAPRADERVTLWLQNSHSTPIPPGAIALNRMGAENQVPYPNPIAPFATVALDVASLLPGLLWPAQIELRAGRHLVRPRYEVTRGPRTRIAHVNVERADLRPDPAIPTLPQALGRGFLLPFPVLDRARYRTLVQPTPMAETQADLPLRLDLFAPNGAPLAQHFLGRLPRDHNFALDLSDLPGTTPIGINGGHAELVYDFRDGGTADGWLHALFRYEDRATDHTAETSFGAHIFNTAMTWRDEPQSYTGPPPGLSTRLFLKLGDTKRRAFCHLIYPASAAWHPNSATELLLHDTAGAVIATHTLTIACSGSAMIWPDEIFTPPEITQAGPTGYILIRDRTCRLFGYHGLMDAAGGFSLDHMFGF